MASGTIYVDADACPVKEEIYRVAERHGWPVVLVANRPLLLPRAHRERNIRFELAGAGSDAADDLIAARVGPDDVAVTADVPLAARCVKAGATVVTPAGRILTDASIGLAVAMRDLMTGLRESGVAAGGPPPFAAKDRSRFLEALHQILVRHGRRPP